jgi:hypothetical protein
MSFPVWGPHFADSGGRGANADIGGGGRVVTANSVAPDMNREFGRAEIDEPKSPCAGGHANENAAISGPRRSTRARERRNFWPRIEGEGG